MRHLVLFLIPVLSIFLESTFLSHFTLRGTTPDLILIFVVFFAIINGSKHGFSYGFLCGLFEDLYLGRFIGMNALSKGLTAFIIGKLEVNVFKDNLLVGFGGVVMATVINSIIMFLIALVSIPQWTFDSSMIIDLSGQLVYNGLLSIPFYIWYYRAARNGLLKESKHRG